VALHWRREEASKYVVTSLKTYLILNGSVYSPVGCLVDTYSAEAAHAGRRFSVDWNPTPAAHGSCYFQELKADIIRQHRVLANAALIEARDRNERRGPTTAIPSGNAPQDQGHTTNSASSASSTQSTLTSPQQNGMSTVPLPKMVTEVMSEPQSWTPRAHVRESNK